MMAVAVVEEGGGSSGFSKINLTDIGRRFPHLWVGGIVNGKRLSRV
jgi:hypothetical protein